MSDPTEPFTSITPVAEVPDQTAPLDATPDRPQRVSDLRRRVTTLEKGGRKNNPTYQATVIDRLLDDCLFTGAALTKALEASEEGKRRLERRLNEACSDARQAREQLARLEGRHDTRTPTTAITAVSGGQAFGEDIIAQAEQHAERIIADAEEQADRTLAVARLEADAVPPRPEPVDGRDRDPDNLLALVTWLPAAKTAAHRRVEVLRAAVEALPDAEQEEAAIVAEADKWAAVLPIAATVLNGDPIDVTEVAEAS